MSRDVLLAGDNWEGLERLKDDIADDVSRREQVDAQHINELLNLSILMEAPPNGAVCAQCGNDAAVQCNSCRITGLLLCAACDRDQHSIAHFCDRRHFLAGHFQPLQPCQFLQHAADPDSRELHVAGKELRTTHAITWPP